MGNRLGGTGSGAHGLSFRPDIEGLRAVAIVLVVAFHAGMPAFAGGYIGVDVFFALSGYLITRLLLAEIAETGTIGLVAFYARRARRLLPAMAVMLFATVIVGAIVCSPLEQEALAKTAIATAVYASNLHFARRATDYWAAGAHGDPLLHTWSLSVEEQFYFVWPPVLLFLLWAGRSFAGDAKRRFLVACTTAGAAISFGLAVFLTDWVQPYAFFLPFGRAWEFAAGSLLAMMPVRPGAPAEGPLPTALVATGLAVIFGTALVYDADTTFPGFTAILPVAGTLLVLRGGEYRRSQTAFDRWGLHAPAMQFIGRHSYSWYLWHWPVIVFTQYVFGPLDLVSGTVAVLLSLALSIVSYRFVEAPIRFSRALQRRDRRTILAAGGLTACSLACTVGWTAVARNASERGDHGPIRMASEDLPLVYGMEGCIAKELETEAVGCRIDEGDAGRAVLVGDSHAVSWFPPIHEIAKRRGYELTVLTKTQCPMADVRFSISVLGREYSECGRWRSAAIERIRELRPDVVFVGHAQGYTWGRDPGVGMEEWAEGFERTLAALSAAAQEVVVLRDSPYIYKHVPICLSRAHWRGDAPADCASPAATAYHDALWERELAIAARFANVRMVDLSSRFCSDGVCPPIVDGRIVYRDDNHMTASFARHLEPALAAALGGTSPGRAASAEVN